MHCVFSHSIQNLHVKGVYSKAFYIAMPPTDKNGERYENYSLAEAKYVKTNHPQFFVFLFVFSHCPAI
jgi:hypothetical protein